MVDCIFCKIVAGEIPATVVREDERTIAFMDIAPGTRGHCLVIVPGGLDVMSSVTRFTPATSLMIRFEIRSSRSYGRRAQSAVIASSDVTARSTTGYA